MAWKALCSLQIDTLFSEMYDVGGFPRLSSLACFAQHCPLLRTLRIPLLFVGGTSNKCGDRCHGLSVLHLQMRQWDAEVSSEAVAQQIDGLFPNLAQLDYRYPIRPRQEPRRFQARWDAVLHAWEGLRVARGRLAEASSAMA